MTKAMDMPGEELAKGLNACKQALDVCETPHSKETRKAAQKARKAYENCAMLTACREYSDRLDTLLGKFEAVTNNLSAFCKQIGIACDGRIDLRYSNRKAAAAKQLDDTKNSMTVILPLLKDHRFSEHSARYLDEQFKQFSPFGIKCTLKSSRFSSEDKIPTTFIEFTPQNDKSLAEALIAWSNAYQLRRSTTSPTR